MVTKNKEGSFEVNGVLITPAILELIKTYSDKQTLEYHIDSVKNILVYTVRQTVEDGVFETYKDDICGIAQLIDYMRVFEA